MYAGMPCDRWAYGGADWGKTFVLDERDRLTELDPCGSVRTEP